MTFGQRLADAMAAIIGSWRFIGIQTCTITFWLLLNIKGPVKPDPYPFILLNLLLSFQAAYTGPVLLMSANRQAELDRRRAIENLELDKNDHERITTMLVTIKEIEEDIESILTTNKKLWYADTRSNTALGVIVENPFHVTNLVLNRAQKEAMIPV